MIDPTNEEISATISRWKLVDEAGHLLTFTSSMPEQRKIIKALALNEKLRNPSSSITFTLEEILTFLQSTLGCSKKEARWKVNLACLFLRPHYLHNDSIDVPSVLAFYEKTQAGFTAQALLLEWVLVTKTLDDYTASSLERLRSKLNSYELHLVNVQALINKTIKEPSFDKGSHRRTLEKRLLLRAIDDLSSTDFASFAQTLKQRNIPVKSWNILDLENLNGRAKMSYPEVCWVMDAYLGQVNLAQRDELILATAGNSREAVQKWIDTHRPERTHFREHNGPDGADKMLSGILDGLAQGKGGFKLHDEFRFFNVGTADDDLNKAFDARLTPNGHEMKVFTGRGKAGPFTRSLNPTPLDFDEGMDH